MDDGSWPVGPPTKEGASAPYEKREHSTDQVIKNYSSRQARPKYTGLPELSG
jgi:hypothetical protein